MIRLEPVLTAERFFEDFFAARPSGQDEPRAGVPKLLHLAVFPTDCPDVRPRPGRCCGDLEMSISSVSVVAGSDRATFQFAATPAMPDSGGLNSPYYAAHDVLRKAGRIGDLAVRETLVGGPWPVGVETPAGTMTLGLSRGAMATSGRDVRRWRRGGEELHHLINPATGRPAKTDLVRVTVVASTAVDAEVLAKSLFLAGERDAVCEADELGVPAVLVTQDGRSVLAGGLE